MIRPKRFKVGYKVITKNSAGKEMIWRYKSVNGVNVPLSLSDAEKLASKLAKTHKRTLLDFGILEDR